MESAAFELNRISSRAGSHRMEASTAEPSNSLSLSLGVPLDVESKDFRDLKGSFSTPIEGASPRPLGTRSGAREPGSKVLGNMLGSGPCLISNASRCGGIPIPRRRAREERGPELHLFQLALAPREWNCIQVGFQCQVGSVGLRARERSDAERSRMAASGSQSDRDYCENQWCVVALGWLNNNTTQQQQKQAQLQGHLNEWRLSLRESWPKSGLLRRRVALATKPSFDGRNGSPPVGLRFHRWTSFSMRIARRLKKMQGTRSIHSFARWRRRAHLALLFLVA